jgi:hypothetical protein
MLRCSRLPRPTRPGRRHKASCGGCCQGARVVARLPR